MHRIRSLYQYYGRNGERLWFQQSLRGTVKPAAGQRFFAVRKRRQHFLRKAFARDVADRLPQPLRRALERLKEIIVHMEYGHAQLLRGVGGQRRLAGRAHAVERDDAMIQRGERGKKRVKPLGAGARNRTHYTLSSTTAVRQGR